MAKKTPGRKATNRRTKQRPAKKGAAAVRPALGLPEPTVIQTGDQSTTSPAAPPDARVAGEPDTAAQPPPDAHAVAAAESREQRPLGRGDAPPASGAEAGRQAGPAAAARGQLGVAATAPLGAPVSGAQRQDARGQSPDGKGPAARRAAVGGAPPEQASRKVQPAPSNKRDATPQQASPTPAPKDEVHSVPAAKAEADTTKWPGGASSRKGTRRGARDGSEPTEPAVGQEGRAPLVARAEPQPARPAPAEALEVSAPEPEPEAQEVIDQAVAAEPAAAPLFVVHVTSELAPVAKVGGLADVVLGLSRDLESRGNTVEIVLPKYDCMRYDHISGLCESYRDLWVPWYGGAIHCTVLFGWVHGRKCFFIEPHSGDNFFNRGSIYGFPDDVLRFAFFSRAAMEFLWKSGKHPDIIHCHDWQTALVPVFLYEIYAQMGMTHPRVCFTIHNFKHQGATGAYLLHATGLNRPEHFMHYDRLRDNANPNAVNLMKGGVVYSNFVTTVSPHHAMEAKDLGQGFGLEPTLHIHHNKYGGVVNGIDYDAWSPETDWHIPFHYGIDNIETKYKNKKALRDRLLIADNQKPIVAFVGRLDAQKGLELIRHALFYTLHRGGQYVLLGSSPDPGINGQFWSLKGQFNDNQDCHLEISYNEELAHLIYAGADMMLVPSRFEPCGLTQLIAMRYGTIPIVREVGGLADTVFDKDFSSRPLHERNGYVFQNYDNLGLESALGRAISCYYEYPQDFRELMKNAMRQDVSWRTPGGHYLNIYQYIREK